VNCPTRERWGGARWGNGAPAARPTTPLIGVWGWGGAVHMSKKQVGQMATTEIKILGLRFTLERHDIDEPPASRAQEVGYVRFAGSRTVKVALWKGGQWVDDRGRPFPLAPSCWYSVEGPHGKASD